MTAQSIEQPTRIPARMTPEPTEQAWLHRLYHLRWYAIGAEVVAMAAVYAGLDATLPLAAIAWTFAALIAINVLTGFRLRTGRPASDWELAAHLVLDMTGLGALLYFTGGASNPLISLLLVPLAVAAATLKPQQVLPLAAYSVAAYSLLMFEFEPLELPEGTLPYSLHLIGMWATYVLAATLTAGYVTRMASELRERDRELALARERELRNEQIIALGTLAAGAAHELGTPLSTIAVLAPELEQSCARTAKQKEDFALLRTQVGLCRGILTNLLAHTGRARSEGGKRMSVDVMLEETVAKWRLLRPRVRVDFVKEGVARDCEILADDTLRQALLNLLNNAADASPQHVGVRARCEEAVLTVTIIDDGPGIDADTADRVGEPFFSQRQGGMGLGLFLARATIARFGGRLTFTNRPEGGLITAMELPLDTLGVDRDVEQ